MAWTRNRPDTTELPIDALAMLVLKDYDSVDGVEVAELDARVRAVWDRTRS